MQSSYAVVSDHWCDVNFSFILRNFHHTNSINCGIGFAYMLPNDIRYNIVLVEHRTPSYD